MEGLTSFSLYHLTTMVFDYKLTVMKYLKKIPKHLKIYQDTSIETMDPKISHK